MRLLTPPASVAPFGLRAMTMVARAAEGGMADTHHVLLDTVQHMLLGTNLALDPLEPIEPRALAEQVQDPALARQIVRGMLVVSLAVGPATPAQTELIARFAAALGVDEPALHAIELLAHDEKVRFLVDFHRRSNMRDYVDNQYRTQGGLLAVAKGLLDFKGVLHDDALAARFRALADLPPETLGNAFFHHYRRNGFSFPGETGGFPVGAIFHDVGHVLAGYDVNPEGELQVACFQAGYRQNENAFFTILFAVLIHTAGVNVAPIPMPKRLGRIGEEDLAARMIHALRRGAEVKVDLADGWDFWPFMPLPLKEARARIGVPPPAKEYRTGPGIMPPPIGRWD